MQCSCSEQWWDFVINLNSSIYEQSLTEHDNNAPKSIIWLRCRSQRVSECRVIKYQLCQHTFSLCIKGFKLSLYLLPSLKSYPFSKLIQSVQCNYIQNSLVNNRITLSVCVLCYSPPMLTLLSLNLPIQHILFTL